MIPGVSVTKTDGNTGVVTPSSKGICAIIAPCSSGTSNQPSSATKASLVLSTFGQGILTEFAAYMLAVAKKPVVLVKAAATTAGAYSSITLTGTGTSTPTAASSAPIDDFNVIITVVVGGTRGTTGITYTYSLDGGVTTSAVQSLGTAVQIDIPNSGVGVALGVGTLVSGDTITFTTTGPRMNGTDLSNALEALRTSNLGYEMVLVGGLDASSSTVSALDTWLSAREAEGKYRMFVVNSRLKNAGETESTFLTSMTTAWSSVASIRGCVGTDGGDCVSAVPGRGLTQKRPTSLALAARLMASDYGRDAAYVADGPVSGFGLADSSGNPKNHDELLYPGLDALRLATLRSFDRRAGTYITNANVISSPGSDFVYAQHVRVMNRACEIAYDILTAQLSRGVHKSPKTGPNGAIYIAEEDARTIEELVNQGLNELRGQVTDLRFVLSRTDDIGANGPVTLNGDLKIAALAYAKQFAVNASFARTITVQS